MSRVPTRVRSDAGIKLTAIRSGELINGTPGSAGAELLRGSRCTVSDETSKRGSIARADADVGVGQVHAVGCYA